MPVVYVLMGTRQGRCSRSNDFAYKVFTAQPEHKLNVDHASDNSSVASDDDCMGIPEVRSSQHAEPVFSDELPGREGVIQQGGIDILDFTVLSTPCR